MILNENITQETSILKRYREICDKWLYWHHYDDVIMTTLGSQITSLTVVYSIVYSGVDQRKHQSSASLAFVRGIHRDRWIPRTKGQKRGKCFHLMTSSWWLHVCHHRIHIMYLWLSISPGTFFGTYCGLEVNLQQCAPFVCWCIAHNKNHIVCVTPVSFNRKEFIWINVYFILFY